MKQALLIQFKCDSEHDHFRDWRRIYVEIGVGYAYADDKGFNNRRIGINIGEDVWNKVSRFFRVDRFVRSISVTKDKIQRPILLPPPSFGITVAGSGLTFISDGGLRVVEVAISIAGKKVVIGR